MDPIVEIEDRTIFLAIGCGAGVFTSIFAFAGMATCYSAWHQCYSSKEWGICTLICLIFQSLFATPFIAVPLVPYFLFGVWLVPVVGYSLPFICLACCKCNSSKKMQVQNPRFMNNAAENTAIANNQNTLNEPQPIAPIPVIYQYVNNNNNNNAVALQNMAVFNWLNGIGLNQYYDILIKEGYETIGDILTITENDLSRMHIQKQMHVKKVMNKINQSVNRNVVDNGEGAMNNNIAAVYDYPSAPPPYMDQVPVDPPIARETYQ